LCFRFLYFTKETLFNVCETLYVTESEVAEEGGYGSGTLDSQSEFRSTLSDKSRKCTVVKFII
jgi:hypothetical protein